jgi:ferredoxin-NADP reductase
MATLTPDRAGPAGTVGSRTVAVEVLAATPAARDAVTFALALPGTRQAPAPYRPGQFITLAIPYGGTTLYRSYSLCGDGRTDAPWEITVKRTKGGAISNYLLDRVRPGMRLRASTPLGTFTLPADARPGALLIFVAAGSGITPLYGMLRALARLAPAQRPRVQLHYAHHSPADAIFGRQLSTLDPEQSWLKQRWYVSTNGRRLTPEAVLAAAGSEAALAEWFLCGPTTLTRGMRDAALRWGVPQPRLHTEVFVSPASRPPSAAPSATSTRDVARVRLADSGAVLAAQPGETLLETLERSGYRPDFSCRSGACGTCRLKLVGGRVCDGAGDSGALTPDEQAAGHVLSCVARPEGDVTLATAGRRVAAPARPTLAPGKGATQGPPRWRQPLRRGLSAAAVAAFVGMWGLASHTATSATATSSTTTSSSTTSGSSTGSSSSNSSNSTSGSSSSSGSSGSSSVQIPTGSSGANSSTGVS